MIDRFKLGYSNRTLGYRIPKGSFKNGKAIRSRLQDLGIIRQSGHELLRGSVVIPIFDGSGQAVQMYGRKINNQLRPGTPKHLYLPGPHRGVWNLEALAASKEIILCESLIDALTFWCAGFRNVTTSYGVNGFTREHLEAFKSYGTERVLIAYDRDDAGEPAARQLAEKLCAEGIECFRILFPRGMDANEYARKVKPAGKSLELLIRNAEWVGTGKKPKESAPATVAVDREVEESTETRVITETEAVSPLTACSEEPAPVMTQEIPGSSEAKSTKQQPAPGTAPASPVPKARRLNIPTQVKGAEIFITLGDRSYRIRGLGKNMAYDVLKINLLVSRSEEAFHVDTLNLYSARQRAIFINQAAIELSEKEEVIKKDLGKALLKLEELQDEQIRRALEPKDDAVKLSEAERAEALAFLKDPKLLGRISADFETCGLVGEDINRQVGYLAAISRKLERPLAVMVQSSSAAGKSALMEAVLAFSPEEERVQYSAMTGQSLFYMGETDLKHKILAIAEEEGAERASYALKLLQSEGKLSIASTGKEPSSGRLVTHEYFVEGPAAILLTTTAIDLDEELQNRCIVLAVDESREQTRAIHRMQRTAHTLEGLELRMARADLLRLHQNAQRLLRPVSVHNPYAQHLTFLDDTTRTRRDHEKYLTLIDAIALLHQHQRKIRQGKVRGRQLEYVEATIDDIAAANRLANDALGRMLDELSPQTRLFLELIHKVVSAICKERKLEQCDCRFSRAVIRQASGWSYPQVRRHLDRLVEMEYVLVHRGRRGQSFVYELLWNGEGKDGNPFVMGLIDTEKLSKESSTNPTLTPSTSGLTPANSEFDPSLTPHLPPIDPRITPGDCDDKSTDEVTSDEKSVNQAKNAHIPPASKQESYPYEPSRSVIPMSAAPRGE
jgi:DNA primase